MGFLKFIFLSNKKEHKIIGRAGFVFFLYYIFMNFRIVKFLETGKPITNGPFTHAPFRINIFNFDPMVHYGQDGSIITHPFFRLISLPIQTFSELIGNQNITILIIQSLIVSLTTMLIYSYCRNLELNRLLSLSVTGIFGFSSYSTMVALIPDSYAYAQFFIVLSVLYLRYVNHNKKSSVIGLTTLGLFNFGVTLTNVIPYVLSTLASSLDRKFIGIIKKLILTLLLSACLIFVLALIDLYLLPGNSWVGNINGGLQSGGYNYVAKFNWDVHHHVLYSLFIAPFLLPRFQVLDPAGLVAIVTKIDSPFPTVIELTGYLIIFLSILGILLNLNKRNVWVLIIYISFSAWLHLGKGFGLATHEYDLYLYAGHFIFAIVLGIAWLGKSITSKKKIAIILISLLLFISVIQIGNNFKRIGDLRNYIEQVYIFEQ